jgi:hypothetical protein
MEAIIFFTLYAIGLWLCGYDGKSTTFGRPDD